MRLVRDIDFVMEEEAEPHMDQVAKSRTRSRKLDPIQPDLTAAEQPDGAVADAAETPTDPGDAEGRVVEEPVDLAALEALLFSSHHPLTAGRVGELLNLDSTRPVRAAIRQLNRVYAETGRSFRIEQVAGGYQMLTLPQFGDLLKSMHQKEVDAKLSKPALETLAIIAYKQPILRVDIEAVRGVACGETIRSLMEKHLVKIAGRAEEPGRPILYGTTRRFLEVFGLNSLKDLPTPDGAAGESMPRTLQPQRVAEEAPEPDPTPETDLSPSGPS
jgi:segregation and condensation protein B